VRRFPVIAGPTAGGKSDLAVEVALALGERGTPGEVVSADSVQILRGMDIGSGKATVAERRGVPHHLIDIVEPTEAFTVNDWLAGANRAVAEIGSRGGVPVVVGGTHLYVKAFLEGLFEGPEPDEALREELRGMGLARLRAELERVDPAAAARIHPNDERRTVRALEVYRQTGRPISEHQRQWDRGARSDCVLVGIEWPVEELNRRINARVKGMMAAGLLEEVRGLWSAGRLGPQAREALGYKQLLVHLEGRCSLEDAVEAIKIETRRFAKNQRTWIRRLKTIPGAVWIDAGSLPRSEWVGLVQAACDRSAPPESGSQGMETGS
jgi:tRNA dimethylallyltransferase